MIDLLKGIRVIECAVLLNGDLTGRLLGDLGADVVKVESPGSGDALRDMLGQIAPHNSPAHLFANRNKRSMTLDLRTVEGRDVFFDLLRTTDLFVDGFAGDSCTRLGIGYEDQRRVKSDIIYAQCTGFGADGPYASVPTHAFMMGALVGGLAPSTGEDGVPHDVPNGLVDGSAVGASFTVLTALAALVRRQRTGEGARIDAAGSDSILATAWMDPTYLWNDERLTDRQGLGAASGAKYTSYETKDGKFIFFSCAEVRFWNKFCRAVDRQDIATADDAEVDFGIGDDELRRDLQAIFRTRTQAQWIDLAVTQRLPLGPAHRLKDVRTDPHVMTRQIIHEGHHPEAGPFTSVGWPAPVAGQRFDVAQPAPALGQHTDEILAGLGYASERIAALRAGGIL